MENFKHIPRLTVGKVEDKVIFYRDINRNFLNEAKVKPLILTDLDAIQAQMINVLVTPTGTEEFMPTYGSLLPFRLGEPMNVQTSFLLEEDTHIALDKWMKEHIIVYMNGVYVTPVYEYDYYDIEIPYRPKYSMVGTIFNFRAYR